MTNFSDVFLPIFSALMAWSVIMEAYQALVAFWVAKRRAKLLQEGYAHMGLDGADMLSANPHLMYALQNTVGGMRASSEAKDQENSGAQAQHGQYL